RGLGDVADDEARRLQLLRAEAMPGDVDDVVDAAEDAEVAVIGADGAVAGEVRPVAPVLRAPIAAVPHVIRGHEAGGVAPDRLQDARPRIANADVSRSEERRVGKECRYRWSPDH